MDIDSKIMEALRKSSTNNSFDWEIDPSVAVKEINELFCDIVEGERGKNGDLWDTPEEEKAYNIALDNLLSALKGKHE